MFQAIIDLFFPKVCFACYALLKDYEMHICTTCRHNLPVTNFHSNGNNAIEKILYGRAKIEQGTALLWFEKKGIVQQLIHNLKYRGYEDIGVFLGEWLGNELKEIEAYHNIDVVIPVPLHKKKRRKRGFNQVTKFGEEIAKALQADFNENCLIKITNTKSQVTKKRFARWQANQELFTIKNPEQIENKHILLVDDIITTGATMEACIEVLNKAKNVKISIATMAIVN
ncbi:ComF family protein [Oceanihabitans sediminis]|uniref:ComF family protein n=2 Tax=Oceanihabitans sediminis TaxID=1812012 RepID=A0A368PAT3_9FLAO|nr:phosphoribosyltransferase family protein [Oceanihabitans sediminis]MDX1773202.1 phosphoribosyltransferase family protein [Oceanihabitans sediminis]RCU58929.1 ComF family protein [Oceanihabitans sediminis]